MKTLRPLCHKSKSREIKFIYERCRESSSIEHTSNVVVLLNLNLCWRRQVVIS